jgi:hypothetical protein
MAPTLPRWLAALTLLGWGAGCAPEVVLATSANAGGSGGAAGSGGSGGDVGGAASPPPRLLADSVADFSLTQGLRGWYYGSDEGRTTDFTPLTRLSVITNYVPPSGDVWSCWASDNTYWTQLFELGGHPNGTDTSPPSVELLQRAVRRWISTYAGEVRITGEIAKLDATTGSNGVDASVEVDGVEQYSSFVAGDDSAGLSYEVVTRVELGSAVDFALDPHEGSDHHDLTRFTGIIERLPSP